MGTVTSLRTYAGLRYIGPMLIDTTSAGGPYGQASNTVYNASAIYALNKSMDVVASVVNLFNRQYSENSYNYSQPYNQTLSMPRSVNAGLNVRF